MLPDFRALMAPQMLVLGAVTVALVVIILALTRNWSRLLIGFVGTVGGYVLLGTAFGWHLAAVAERRGACPDAAWFGGAEGALVGSVVVLVVRAGVRQLRDRGGTATRSGVQ